MDIRFTVFRIFAATIFTEHEKDTSCCSAVLFYTDLSYDVLLLAASVLARDTKKVTANSGQSLWTWTYSSASFYAAWSCICAGLENGASCGRVEPLLLFRISCLQHLCLTRKWRQPDLWQDRALDVYLLVSIFACSTCAGYGDGACCGKEELMVLDLLYSIFDCCICAGHEIFATCFRAEIEAEAKR